MKNPTPSYLLIPFSLLIACSPSYVHTKEEYAAWQLEPREDLRNLLGKHRMEVELAASAMPEQSYPLVMEHIQTHGYYRSGALEGLYQNHGNAVFRLTFPESQKTNKSKQAFLTLNQDRVSIPHEEYRSDNYPFVSVAFLESDDTKLFFFDENEICQKIVDI